MRTGKKPLYAMLGVEFAALMALALLPGSLPGIFTSVIAFPLEQIGAGLRALSLCGRVGNGLALAIMAGLSLPALIPALRHIGVRERAYENAALLCLAALLFLVLRGMASPTLLRSLFPEADVELMPVMKAIMGGTVWSVLVLWAVLRLLRLFRAGNTETLFGYMRKLLYALCALFTGAAALSLGGGIAGVAASGGINAAMAVLRLIAGTLPYFLDIAVTLPALDLLSTLLEDGQPGSVEAADRLSRRCRMALGVTAAASAALNILCFALARRLTDVSVNVVIPLVSIAFVLTVLLASRLIAENRRLRDDSESII